MAPLPTVRGGEELYTDAGPGDTLERVVDPEFHMAAARRALESGREVSAAREIEKLVAFVEYEADRTAGDRRRALQDARDDLRDLEKRVSDGEASLTEVDQVFGRARSALRR